MHKRKRIARDVERRIIWRPFTIRKSSTKPIHIIKAQDEKLFDSKGKEYLDLISSWWVSIHGHRDANIIAAIKKQLNKQIFETIYFGAMEASMELAKDKGMKLVYTATKEKELHKRYVKFHNMILAESDVKTVSYTHLRAHETPEQRGSRVLV